METSTEDKEKGEQMSKLMNHAQNFLEDVGYGLGYDERNLPELKDIKMVWQHHIHIWEYKGLTEEEYYGVDENEGKTMP